MKTSVPLFRAIICLICLVLGGLSGAVGAPPEIGRVQGYAGGHWLTYATVWGSGFDEDVEIFGWSPDLDEEEILAVIKEGRQPGRDLLPEEPPEGSRKLPVKQRNEQGTVLSTQLGRMQVLWAKTSEGFSQPFVVHLPEVWWAFPSVASPRERVRLFGRALSQRFVDSPIVLRSVEDGSVVVPAVGGGERNFQFERRIFLPEDLAPGKYEVFVHNGSAGVGGWSHPLLISVVEATTPLQRQVINVMDHGAVGDGVADDTEALFAAVKAAGEVEHGTVFLPPGTYNLRRTLVLPEGVEIRGMNSNSVVIQVAEELPMLDSFPFDAEFEGYPTDWVNWWKEQEWRRGVMVWARNQNTIRNVHFRLGPGTSMAILVARTPGTAENIRILNNQITAMPFDDREPASCGIYLMGETHRMEILENHFVGIAISSPANRHDEANISYNTAIAARHGHPLQNANLVFLRGMIRSVIEENDLRNGDRNMGFQSGRVYGKDAIPEGMQQASRPSFHTALIGNRFTDNIPRRHNAGEIMFEGGAIFWNGRASAVAENEIVVEDAPFNSNLVDNQVLIMDGPGIGQYRRVVEHTASKLVLDRPWDAMPDETSYLAVGNFTTEFLWIDNTDQHTANWTGFWGGHLGHVISGQINRDGDGLYLWAYSEKSVIGFVDIENSYVSGRGQIVLRGAGPIFGTTIFGNEVIDFRRRPNLHGTQRWRHPRMADSQKALRQILDRPGIILTQTEISEEFPATTPSRDWNIIERNLILNGPTGIWIEEGARFNIIEWNAMGEVGERIVDDGEETLIGNEVLPDAPDGD